RRYRLPEPRLGLVRPELVRACMDVSDGLVQDLAHLCRAAGLGAEIHADLLPLSPEGAGLLETCITGGDDYELLMAVPPGRAKPLREEADRLGIVVTEIGRFVVGDGVRVLDRSGAPLEIKRGGWSHF
ncbi:MAG TPA: AIR synthase-related protein, partial [Acetobacteraceae bacterium]|nr:AIR synthase-related protein [Acetobacteraceae bacterium]